MSLAHFKLRQVDLSGGNSTLYALRSTSLRNHRATEEFGLVRIPLFKSDSQPEPLQFFNGKSDQEMLDTLLEKYTPTRLDEIRKYIGAILTKAQSAILAQSASV